MTNNPRTWWQGIAALCQEAVPAYSTAAHASRGQAWAAGVEKRMRA